MSVARCTTLADFGFRGLHGEITTINGSSRSDSRLKASNVSVWGHHLRGQPVNSVTRVPVGTCGIKLMRESRRHAPRGGLGEKEPPSLPHQNMR